MRDIQHTLLRILLNLAAFRYGSITLYGSAFQQNSRQQLKGKK